MVVVESYALAVAMCVITMLCWGSWANTQKLTSKEWRFELFYWDYAIGVMLFSLALAFTAGVSIAGFVSAAGSAGRPRTGTSRSATAWPDPPAGAGSAPKRSASWPRGSSGSPAYAASPRMHSSATSPRAESWSGSGSARRRSLTRGTRRTSPTYVMHRTSTAPVGQVRLP